MQKREEPASIPEHSLQISSTRDGYLLEARQWIPLPQETVFQFFAEPRNLGRITPPWMRFQMLDADRVKMEEGARIHYIVRWLNFPLRWTTMISSFQPPEVFADTQESGPYSCWVHQHRFIAAAGGTWMEDRVTYRLPFGILGRLVHAVMVKRQLQEIFLFRARAIEQLLLDRSHME